MLFPILTAAVGFTSIKMGHNCTRIVVSILVRLVLLRYKISREGWAKSWFYHLCCSYGGKPAGEVMLSLSRWQPQATKLR